MEVGTVGAVGDGTTVDAEDVAIEVDIDVDDVGETVVATVADGVEEGG